MKKCKYCGEINTSDSQFCDNCGKDTFIFNEEKMCPHCGIVNDSQYTHCVNCGNLLQTSTTAVIPKTDSNVVLDMSGAVVDLRSELQQVYDNGLTNVAVKETTKCPNCGAELQINGLFCYKCGTPVGKLHEHKVVSRKMCLQCHTPNLLTSPHCSYCYSSLAEAPIEEFQLVHESRTLGKTIVKQAMLEGVAGKYLICNNCGALNSRNDLFCVACGLKLVIEEQLRYCVNCGAENDADAQFCTKCQWSFDGVSPDSISGVWTCDKCNHINSTEDEFCTGCGTAHSHKNK